MHGAGGAEPALTAVPGQASDDQAAFERFVEEAGPRLGRALTALYGFEDGRDATAEALAYAWENWHRLQHIANLPGYLFRVGQTRGRRRRQPAAGLFDSGAVRLLAKAADAAARQSAPQVRQRRPDRADARAQPARFLQPQRWPAGGRRPPVTAPEAGQW